MIDDFDRNNHDATCYIHSFCSLAYLINYYLKKSAIRSEFDCVIQ